MGELRHLPRRSEAPEKNHSLHVAPVIPLADKKAEKEVQVRITSRPALSSETWTPPKPDERKRLQKVIQGVFYSVGKFVLMAPEVMIGGRGTTEEARRRRENLSAEIDARPSYKVRRWGAATLAFGLATATAVGIYSQQAESPDLPVGEPTCEFVHDPANPKIVVRGVSKSNQALAVEKTKGVNWNQGNIAAEEWIKAHNPPLNGWPGEEVVIPEAYICE
jgi:hypothetical protein